MTKHGLADALNRHAADLAVLTQRLRAFHWMVTGPQFFQLHALFEKEYDRWADAADEFAERSLALGGTPPLTLADVLRLATLEELPGTLSARGMVERYRDDLVTLRDSFARTLEAAEEAGDRPTANLLDGHLDGIAGTLWMLGAWLEGR